MEWAGGLRARGRCPGAFRVSWGILGLGAFWAYYWLLSKKINPSYLVLGTMVLGVIGAFFGFLAMGCS